VFFFRIGWDRATVVAKIYEGGFVGFIRIQKNGRFIAFLLAASGSHVFYQQGKILSLASGPPVFDVFASAVAIRARKPIIKWIECRPRIVFFGPKVVDSIV